MDSGVALKESNSSFPIKRKPEEEVQFVSSKPVKKCRGSKDSPADAYRAVDQANISKVVPVAGDTRLGDASGHLGPSPPTDQQLHELSNFNRGVSLPSMENYVFPPPHDAITSPTSRSSPMLSPKQLPQAVPLSQADSQPSNPVPSTANDSKPPAWLNASWAASGVPPQPSSMNLHMTVNQPMMTPYVQPPTPEPSAAAAALGEKGCSSTPERLADSAQCPELASHPGKQLGMDHTQHVHQHRPQDNPESTQVSQPSEMQKAYQSVQAIPRTSPGQMPRTQPPSQHTGNSNGYAVATAHPLPAKPPCFTCEQIRQQALHNKTNIYPLVGTASHTQHGWHGPEVAHLPHPALMQPAPFPNAGFGVSPDVSQNHMQRSQHLYHGPVPMGYGLTHMPAQGPYPSPIQRAFPVADMSASDSGPVVSSHKLNRSPQLNVSLGSTTMAQTERAQYTQAQCASSQPPATQPSSAAAPSTPAAAPTPRPPTPSPTEKHSQNLIVDIAETCEALFPWDAVAERHNVPRQKVVDTFAAIIQLPLIRCTTDKKRHGRLATNRLKDYTRGKNAMYMSSPASPATPPTSAKSDSSEAQEKRPVLPGVVELANTMAPVGFPSTLTKKYPGTW